MNRSEMRLAVRDLLNEEVEGFWLDAQLNRYLELGNKRVNLIIAAARQDYFTKPVTFSSVVGTKSYEFPSDCVYIRRMEIYDPANIAHIDKIDELRFPRIEANGDWPFMSNGQPQRYIIVGTHFDLFPIPDAVYPIRFFYDYRPVPLATDASVPSSPLDFHIMIVFYACMLAKKQNETDDEGFAAMFKDMKPDLLQTITRRGGDDPVAVESYLEGII